MGQIQLPQGAQTLILSAVDRLVASNADGGMSPAASHVILLGEQAGKNLGPLTDIIVFGAQAFDAGVADVAFNGSAIIGRNAASALTSPTGNWDGTSVGMTVIGADALALAVRADSSVIIGSHALNAHTGAVGQTISKVTAIGSYVLAGLAGQALDSLTAIGFKAFASNQLTNVVNSTVIGSLIGSNAFGVASGNVLIGAACAANLTNCTDNVFIGQNCSNTPNGATQSVVIGQSASVTSASESVVIGQACNGSSASQSVQIGGLIQAAGSRNVILGYRAQINSAFNVNGGPNGSNKFIVGTVANVHMYGDMSTGSIVIGNSDATNEDLPGTNILKLLNGTTAGATVGGGYFFVSAGELRWVNTAGIEQTITGIYTVATLPAPIANRVGSRAFVTDATAPVFGALAVGGGAVFSPVYCDGTNWLTG